MDRIVFYPPQPLTFPLMVAFNVWRGLKPFQLTSDKSSNCKVVNIGVIKSVFCVFERRGGWRGRGLLWVEGSAYNQVTLNIALPPRQSGCDSRNNGWLALNTEFWSSQWVAHCPAPVGRSAEGLKILRHPRDTHNNIIANCEAYSTLTGHVGKRWGGSGSTSWKCL